MDAGSAQRGWPEKACNLILVQMGTTSYCFPKVPLGICPCRIHFSFFFFFLKLSLQSRPQIASTMQRVLLSSSGILWRDPQDLSRSLTGASLRDVDHLGLSACGFAPWRKPTTLPPYKMTPNTSESVLHRWQPLGITNTFHLLRLKTRNLNKSVTAPRQRNVSA